MNLKRLVLMATLLTCSLAVHADDLVNFGDYPVSNQRDCFAGGFGDYDAWRDWLVERNPNNKTEQDKQVARERFSNAIPAADHAHFKQSLTCNWFTYSVDGGEVHGYIIQPKDADEALPVLIYNRGGNHNYGGVVFGNLFSWQFQYADEGFVVIGSQYRGTFVNEINPDFSDEFGGADVNDVLELINMVPYLEHADEDRIGMMGHSRGSMQTMLALRHATRLKAVAVLAGNYDLVAGLEARPEMENVYRARISDYEANKEEALAARSALQWVDELDESVPILIAHGQDDQRVLANQSLQLAQALQAKGHPYKLVMYPQDDHGFRMHRDEVNREVVAWFEKYLR